MYHPLVFPPISHHAASAPVYDEFIGLCGYPWVKVVHKHAQGGLAVPRLTGKRCAGRGLNGFLWSEFIKH